MAPVPRRIAAPGMYRPARHTTPPQRQREYLQSPRSRTPEEPEVEVLLRTTEVARELQVSARTVLAWAQAGKLPSILTPGGHRRYPARGVAQVLAAMTAAGDQPRT